LGHFCSHLGHLPYHGESVLLRLVFPTTVDTLAEAPFFFYRIMGHLHAYLGQNWLLVFMCGTPPSIPTQKPASHLTGRFSSAHENLREISAVSDLG